MHKIFFIFILAIIASFAFSCRKDSIETNTSANLNFSTDSILFDTVFTTIGSTTKRLKVYNRNSKKIVVSSISLDQGANSQFRINVDGISSNIHKDVEINGNDSIFIFIEVTIDPNNTLSPFVVEEKLNFVTNNNNQAIQLVAWGQNAHYFTPKNFSNSLPDFSCLDGDCGNGNLPVNATWVNDKPYVVYGFLVIDSLDILNIDPGVRIHFHNNSGLWVYKDGNIKVNGTVDDPVTFQGTRLEYAWKDIAGQWDRIWINEGSKDNVFNYAIIKNAFIGIQAETLPFSPNTPISLNKLRLNNCEILNSSAVGILATNYRITDTNSIIGNSGQYNLFVRGGGEYQFNHSTIANYWNETSRETPSVFLQNYYTDINGATQVRNIDSANFYNCIVHGNLEVEFDIDDLSPGTINYKFTSSILKTTENTSGANFINIIKNPTVEIFSDKAVNNYRLTSGSPAINAGVSSGVLLDHDGVTRNNPPDIGAYEN